MVLGWPKGVASGSGCQHVSDSQLLSLIGEGVHLGCMGTVLYLAWMTPAAPWWQ